MDFLTADRRRMLEAVSRLAYCNPFLPERMELERAVLGEAFEEGEPVWSQQVDDPDRPRPNVWRIAERLEPLLNELNAGLHGGAKTRERDLVLYEDAALALLYQRYYERFLSAAPPGPMALLHPIPRRLEPLLRHRRRPFSERARAASHVRVFPADPARVRPIVSRRNRRLDARGAVAVGGMAIDLHA